MPNHEQRNTRSNPRPTPFLSSGELAELPRGHSHGDRLCHCTARGEPSSVASNPQSAICVSPVWSVGEAISFLIPWEAFPRLLAVSPASIQLLPVAERLRTFITLPICYMSKSVGNDHRCPFWLIWSGIRGPGLPGPSIFPKRTPTVMTVCRTKFAPARLYG